MMQEDTLTKNTNPTFKQVKKPVQYTIDESITQIIFPENGSGMSLVYPINVGESLEYDDYLFGYFDE